MTGVLGAARDVEQKFDRQNGGSFFYEAQESLFSVYRSNLSTLGGSESYRIEGSVVVQG